MFNPFVYKRPNNLEQVFTLLDQNEDVKIIAGGTDLLVKLREADRSPELLVDIKDLEKLKGIKKNKNEIKIGALTTITEIKESKLIKDEFDALYQAASQFGCYEIRNRATIGGNVVHASPGAEFGVVLFALNAEVEVVGKRDVKRMPIKEFLYDVGSVKLNNELLKSIIIKNKPDLKSSYHRISRVKGMDLALVNAALVKDDKAQYTSYFGAVARTPYNNNKVDELLSQSNLNKALFVKIQKIVDESISPRATSLRASPEYKKKMVVSLLKKCLRDIGEIGDDIDG